MNILLATTDATPKGGGIASYNQELLFLLSKTHNIYLITNAKEDNVIGYKETFSTFGKDRYTYEFSQCVISKIENWQIDVIINSASDIMAIIAPFVKVPIITVSHFVNGKLALVAGYNNEFLNCVISLSYYGKEYLIKKYAIQNANKVKVVYNFVADKDICIHENKIYHSPITIVYPGGTSIKKSFEVVLKTVLLLLKTNWDFKFIWLGSNKLPLANISPRKNLKQFFKTDRRLILTENVPREDAIKYLENTNVFLLPSRGEGCPMTLLEAMRAGCIPIVSDSLHASREILLDGDFGIIVKQGNHKALFNAIKSVIENHSQYCDNYKKTYSYSRSALSQTTWNEQMDNIVNYVLNQEKKSIELTPNSFRKSLVGFRRRYRVERLKEQIASIIVRIKLEWIYLFLK